MKAQIAGQILIYVLGIITMGLLLLLGYSAITKIMDNKCTVQRTEFMTKLQSSIEKNMDFGTQWVEDVTLPCDAQQVCFVDRGVADIHEFPPEYLDPGLNSLVITYGAIIDSIESGVSTNVWLKTASGYEPVEQFSVPAAIDLGEERLIFCIPEIPTSDQTAKILFIGKGRSVQVNDASSD